MRLGIERLRRIMDDERRGILIDGPAERIAEAAYKQGARDMRERCANACLALAASTNADGAMALRFVAAIRALKDGEEC